MTGQRRRFIILAMLMVILVGAVSLFATRILYQTAIEEQKKRLHELVKSQAALVTELGLLTLQLQMASGEDVSEDTILIHLSEAHKAFQIESKSGEFTLAKRSGSDIQFLVVNGERVKPDSKVAAVPLGSGIAQPMENALYGITGASISKDYNGVEVLAAYTPLFLRHEVLGLVAKIDIDEIRDPFIRANLFIFGGGIVLTIICIIIFFIISEPIIRKIQANEKKYRDLVEGSNSLILRLNLDGEITFSNRFADTLLARKDKTLLGRHFSSLAEDMEVMGIQGLMEHFEKSENLKEMKMIKSTGAKVWVSWSLKPIMDNDSLTELLCLGNNVTNAHMIKEAQWEMEERFRGIAKASPVGIIITDLDGKLNYANERMHELTGADAFDLTGRGWLDRFDPRDKQGILMSWFAKGKRNRPRKEFQIIPKNGTPLWVLGQIVELRSSDNTVTGNVLTFTDISQIKEAERAQRQLTAAIEQAREIIFITDLDGNITYVNPAFERVTGYSKREAIGQNPNILKSGEHSPEFYAEMWETLNAGNVWLGQVVNNRKDGRRFTLDTSIAPIKDKSDKIICYVDVSRDITEQLTVEAQLRQAQKLESIGELAAGIAHEINTPAQYVSTNLQFLEDSIKTYSETMKRCRDLIKLLQTDAPDMKQVKEMALKAVDEKEIDYLDEDIPSALSESATGLVRISEIVRSVKQLAHPGEVSRSYYDLNTIVRDAATVSTNEWKYAAEIVYDLDEALPNVKCLKGEIGQVILNLIVNSAHAIQSKQDAADERGVITLRTFPEGDNAVLEVSDTGSGIPQKIIDKVFDPFFTTKDVGKGTGQGLAITYNVIVNMHGGSVDIQSEEGKGTTMTVRLPFDDDGFTEPGIESGEEETD